MKYFIDTEFLEGSQDIRLPFNIKVGKTKPTIDLISIGIVAEDGKEYYAISKDFNLREAWNRFQVNEDDDYVLDKNGNEVQPKIYWIRDNVLKPIFNELTVMNGYDDEYSYFTYNNFKYLIKKYGKTNNQIAEEIKDFIYRDHFTRISAERTQVLAYKDESSIEFYAYYADYDWVAFCWLFGKMIDLPKGFPMYCKELKQELDETAIIYHSRVGTIKKDFNTTLNEIKSFDSYPKQTNKHNAIDDAKWNRALYKFLKTIK